MVGAGKGLAAAVAAAAIYRLVYSYGSLYDTNTYQHAYLLGPKSYAEAARPYAGGHERVTGARRGHSGGGGGGSSNSSNGGGGRAGVGVGAAAGAGADDVAVAAAAVIVVVVVVLLLKEDDDVNSYY